MLRSSAKRIFIIAQIFLSCYQSYSQQPQEKFPFIHIEYFQSEQGLNGNDVSWITQDQNGFMWFITDIALNRYDGYSFKSYSYKANDRNSLAADWYWGLAEDKNGIIWIPGAQSGLYSFDPTLEKFTHYQHEAGNINSLISNSLYAAVPDNDGVIWIGTDNGLDKFNSHTKTFTHFQFNTSNTPSIKPKHINSAIKDENNPDNLWLVDRNTLSIECFNTKSGKVIKQFDFPFPTSSYEWYSDAWMNINRMKNGNIWFGSNHNGLFGFNTITSQFNFIKMPGTCHRERHMRGFYSVMEDDKGNLWTANDNNEVVYYDTANKKFFYLPVTKNDISFIDNASIFYIDRNDKVWICTNNGLIAIDTKQKNISVCKVDNSSISSNLIFGIFRTRQGNLLVGTDLGIDIFDTKTKTFSPFRLVDKNGKNIIPFTTWTMFQDSKNILWLAGAFGIASYDPVSKLGRVHHFYNDSADFNMFGSVSVTEDKNGRYWSGNFGGGLYTFDPITDRARAFRTNEGNNSISTNSVGPIFMDSKGTFYIHGLQGGFIRFDPKIEEFKIWHHNANDPFSLSSENALASIETENGLLWIHTLGAGVAVFNPANEKFVSFTTEHGLAHNSVYSLTADKNGDYWAGTRNGISRFTPPKDPFAPGYKIIFRNYDMNDGLPSNTLNNISAFCDTDGTMYFGARNGGLFYFHPNHLKDNDYKPPVYITELRLKNNLINVTDTNSVLETAIEYTKEIKLNYRQNMISFSFAALNYIHPEKNKYAYMLEGYDEDWVYTDASKRFVNYTNLDPGNYTFKVKASNNDGVWNETPTELKILITPPFWKTTWFRVLLIIAAAGVLYAVYRYRLQQVLKLQSLRNKIAADLHDDIGSTLNSISVYSEVAENDPSRRSHSLQMIGESSRKVIDAMSDIVWTINPDNDNFEKIILRMRSLAYNLLRAKKIEFSFRADESLNDLKLSLMVRRNFYFIFKEALNNLIKYSAAKQVSIQLEKKSNNILLLIRDDGVGFDPGTKYNGNGLTNMRRRSKEINAQLNIESGRGSGTSIQLTLKS